MKGKLMKTVKDNMEFFYNLRFTAYKDRLMKIKKHILVKVVMRSSNQRIEAE
jgi:hypothetical protein